MAGILARAPTGVQGHASAGPRSTQVCEPGSQGCPAAESRMEDTTPAAPEHHPCDWVETCQLPCTREGGQCCHAEWSCPPDVNLPRC